MVSENMSEWTISVLKKLALWYCDWDIYSAFNIDISIKTQYL